MSCESKSETLLRRRNKKLTCPAILEPNIWVSSKSWEEVPQWLTNLDGTIDTTRTIYYGDKPSDEIKRAYTRVLQGHIAVAQFSFPEDMDASWMNMLARAPLYQ
jgi:hypothetical protein